MAHIVDNLSDAELRTKLAEYGFPVVPITATTRGVMVKKLKLLIDNKSKISSEARRSLGRYSSGEESDNDIKDTKQKDKNRRITLGGPMLPPSNSPKLRKGIKKTEASKEEPETSNQNQNETKSSTTVTTRRTTRTQYKTTNDDEFEDGSDSDIEIIERSTPPKTSSYTSHSSPLKNNRNEEEESHPKFKFQTPFTFKPSTESSSSSINASSGLRSSGLRSSLQSQTTSQANQSKPLFSFNSGDSYRSPSGSSSAMDSLNQIRARLNLSNYSSTLDNKGTTSGYGRASVYATSSVNKDAPVETPYFSEFSKRLSQVTGTSKRSDDIKESETNGSTYARSFLNRYGGDSRNRDISKEFKSSQEKNIFKNNLVSFTLLGVACLFFLALSFLYMGMRSDQVPILTEEDIGKIPYCKTNDLLDRPGVTCVKQDAVKGALYLINELLPELHNRAVNFMCGYQKTPAYMTDNNIIDFIKKTKGQEDEYLLKQDVYNLQVLVLHNSHWNIELIKIDNIYKPGENEVSIKTVDTLIYNRERNYLAIVMKDPDLPFKCWVFKKLYTFLTSALFIVVCLLIIYSGQQGVKYYMDLRKQKEEQVYNMVEKIIYVLSTNCSGENNDNYLAVNHVRDVLIPPQDRQKMSSIWNAAVNFIENNESRVRSEVQIVAGEEYNVWRWLDNTNLNLSSNLNRSKVWQGQAFETQEGSVNSLPNSPTQCLKIRHMFDKNESSANWTTDIKDAILEKCENCKIYHIGIDTSTCCVYVKCASQHDAGIAYKNLHGGWYDGKLVTVKYLRLERYMDRFPDSPSSGAYLKPSNNQRLSLRNYWSNNEDN